MSAMTLAHTNGSAAGMLPWLKHSVQQFFQGFNWDNLPPSVETTSPSSAPATVDLDAPLSLTLSVSQFFGAVAWDGSRAIGSPVRVEEPVLAPAPENNFTIDNAFDSW